MLFAKWCGYLISNIYSQKINKELTQKGESNISEALDSQDNASLDETATNLEILQPLISEYPFPISYSVFQRSERDKTQVKISLTSGKPSISLGATQVIHFTGNINVN